MLMVILDPNYQSYLKFLQTRFGQIEFIGATCITELPTRAIQAQALICHPQLGADYIDQQLLPNLCWVQSLFAGIEPLLKVQLPKECVLTNSRGMFGPLMSEYIFSYLLANSQHHQIYSEQQSAQLWQPANYQSIASLKLAILGAGSIAQHLAKTAKYFGMSVSAFSRSGNSPCPSFDHVYRIEQFNDYATSADVVVAVLPSTPQTQKICGSSFFDSLKRDCWFFNVGRGACVDEDALLNWLQHNHCAQAILDVTVEEPLPQGHPFWTQANLRLTPHCAAPSLSQEISKLVESNIEAFIRQKALNCVVNIDLAY
ncbi:D-2-hydroxyacid dehydrogenase [Alginatibacterium sediminis]|uniref:D-2-hydroxyacid dehydrogenase n=1 Tax=Alginatibacterium sediminis TaxID=2164068 RepID=A0A420E8D9_9ALTE|nr:D-2-hydroxyacid dehydrogenase [Alginatibacterium sediminis]RKF14443.1 D-2-hydroxyacid dehydrogenase [Alginatibacterium sediminis]